VILRYLVYSFNNSVIILMLARRLGTLIRVEYSGFVITSQSRARSRADTQNSLSMVTEISQDKTYRLYQSMTAVK
jgi:hypothetical protein